jgi:hypothetical protein
MSHALERTSPLRTPFVGRCTKCGRENIALKDMHGHCPNPGNLSDTDTLRIALRDPSIVQ